MFIFNRLSLGGRLSSMSKSSSDSPSSSKIWLSTGALFRDVSRLVMDSGLRRRTTWVGNGKGSCSSSSSSSSSTRKRQVRSLAEVDARGAMTPGLRGFGGRAAELLEASLISSLRLTSRNPLLRWPFSRFSVLRAGDCGPPTWEMDEEAKLSSMSWCKSFLDGHDCLQKKKKGT